MPATKRDSTDDGLGEGHRASKVAKTNTGKKGESRARRVLPPRSKFKEEALPIHVNFTYTPPPTVEQGEGVVTKPLLDQGHVGNMILLPTEFSTGSYGWKGSGKMMVTLQDALEGVGTQGREGQEQKEVQIMINVNATVIGSKDAQDPEKDKGGPEIIVDNTTKVLSLSNVEHDA